MDDFSIDRPELSGSLIQMEFGKGGRIRKLWVTDPSRPENGDNFQFALPSIAFGEETSDDYLPGTILLGARTSPEEPWILSRNNSAESLDKLDRDDDDDGDPDESALDLTSASVHYEFPLLPEVYATGRFYEKLDPMPHVLWDIEITNRGQGGLEIGELAFPLAFNNLYEGIARTADGAEELWLERCAVHTFIGGAASYLYVQRLVGEPPGLIVAPGDKTSWEFFNHVPASLATGFRWEGIPVIYIHSQAAMEREGWPQVIHGHSSVTLEQGETRTYQIKFLPTETDRFAGFQSTLHMFGHPVIRLWPSAVAPAEVGITVELAGSTPTQFHTDVEAEIEPDSYEGGGSCAIHAAGPGPLSLTFEDTQGRTGHTHLLFTEPIEDLIRRRAEWIIENQVCSEATNLNGAILNTDLQVGLQMTDPDEYQRPFGVLCSLGEALFLAEKNRLEPRREEVEALDRYIESFLVDDLQNPQTLAVGHAFMDTRGVAIGAEAEISALAARLFETMAEVASSYGSTSRNSEWYADRAVRTDAARVDFPPRPRPDLWFDDDLAMSMAEGFPSDTEFPTWNPHEWNPSVFWSSYGHAVQEGALEPLLRMVSSSKAPTPSWWWYGSDKRFVTDTETPHPAMLDKGEICLGPTTPANSLLILKIAEREPQLVPDWMLRAAYGGLLAVWALVRHDGAAAMGYCPDVASRQYGMSWCTGDIGLTLWTYLRGVAAHVYPAGPGGAVAYGCYVESREEADTEFICIRPWDGVARRVVVHDWNVHATCDFARLELFEFDTRLRKANAVLRNTGDQGRDARLTISGLWGTKLKLSGKKERIDASEPMIVHIGAGATLKLMIEAFE